MSMSMGRCVGPLGGNRIASSSVQQQVQDRHPDLDVDHIAYIVKLEELCRHVVHREVVNAIVHYLERVQCSISDYTKEIFMDIDHNLIVVAGDDPAELLAHPWGICHAVKGVGFATFTQLAMHFAGSDFDPYAHERVEAAIIHLTKNNNQGHTKLLPNWFIGSVVELLKKPSFQGNHAAVKQAFANMHEREEIIMLKDGYYQHTDLYDAEQSIVDCVRAYTSKEASAAYEAVDDDVLPAHLDESQRAAVKGMLEHKFYMLTGGPGTGKTTTIKAVLEVYLHISKQAKPARRFCAPSHASKMRIIQVTKNKDNDGKNTQTIQSFVYKYEHATGLVILDEASMVDTRTLARFLKLCSMARHVILVGDAHQLPAIGMGEPFKDLLQLDLPKTELVNVHRQARDNPLVELARRIREGDPCVEGLEDTVKFFDTERQVLDALMEAFVPNKTQIITMNSKAGTTFGIDNLNKHCAAKFHHDPSILEDKWNKFRRGDTVVVTKNSRKFFNGQRGRVRTAGADPDKHGIQRMRVDWEDSREDMHMAGECVVDDEASIVEDGADEDDESLVAYSICKHAFAITTHKAQGSEYTEVLMPVVLEQGQWLLRRELVYTAVTRGKERATVFAQRAAWNRAVLTPYPPRMCDLVGKWWHAHA